MTSGATRLNRTWRFGASVASVLTLFGLGTVTPVVAGAGTDAWSSMSGLDVARQQMGWPFWGGI